jgi:hypothetical protein
MYYAIWYYSIDGEKSTNAISTSIDKLWEIQYTSISKPACYYHEYKSQIRKITVEPIHCYKYNNVTQKIERLDTDELKIDMINGAFYAIDNFPFLDFVPNVSSESLIYMLKEDQSQWINCYEQKKNGTDFKCDMNYPSFFYEEPISNIVIPDTYYEEGIMNS